MPQLIRGADAVVLLASVVGASLVDQQPVVADREAAEIPFDEVKWAKTNKGTPKAVTDVLSVGEVIWVAPKKPDQVLLGENLGHSFGPFSVLPTRNAKMSAAQVTANRK